MPQITGVGIVLPKLPENERFYEDAPLRYSGQLEPQKKDQRDLAEDVTATSSANGKNTLPVTDAGKIRHQCETLSPKCKQGLLVLIEKVYPGNRGSPFPLLHQANME